MPLKLATTLHRGIHVASGFQACDIKDILHHAVDTSKTENGSLFSTEPAPRFSLAFKFILFWSYTCQAWALTTPTFHMQGTGDPTQPSLKILNV